MHVLQGAFRAVLRINWFLFVHHLVFCTIIVLAFQAESIFAVKFGGIVSCFATYEFLLYAALIVRRTRLLKGLFYVLTSVGLAFYFLTRLVQLVLLIGLFVLSYEPMRNTQKNIALWWVCLMLCVMLTILQMYTFVIYRGIWHSTANPKAKPLLITAQAHVEASSQTLGGRLVAEQEFVRINDISIAEVRKSLSFCLPWPRHLHLQLLPHCFCFVKRPELGFDKVAVLLSGPC